MRRTTHDVAQVLQVIRQSCADGLLLLKELEEQQAEDEERARHEQAATSNPTRSTLFGHHLWS